MALHLVQRFIVENPETDLLGRGGMGVVYRGQDSHTGQPVAIKALKPNLGEQDPDLVARFIHEGEALRQLNHPNIVKMIAMVEQDGRNYLIMEYAPGGSLEERLQQGPLPYKQTLEIALDVADALIRTHRLGILHRDLKPANILLAADGTCRLTDFGVAFFKTNDQPRATQAGAMIGTIDYLSPEACQGEDVDERADIWSFGVLLYEMVTGKRPFTGRSIMETITNILTQPTPDMALYQPAVNDALADLIYRMLSKDRLARIPSVRQVGLEIEAMLHGRALPTAVADTPPPQTGHTLTTLRLSQSNLPPQPTPFIGRKTELVELVRLLTDTAVRQITILGVGGMGKTRLALAVGEAMLAQYVHGVHFIPLAPLSDSSALVAAIGEAVNFPFYAGGEPRQQLLDYLHEKQMLLIMDNFEHLLDGADMVSHILRAAPEIKIIATSRAKLGLQTETVFNLIGLDIPADEMAANETLTAALTYSAVELFLQGARRMRPDYEVTNDDLPAITRICRQVYGLPLGIVLASGWVEMLSPAEIAAEIDQSLDFLATELRDMPDRHQSLRAVFDYSWQLLSDRQQEMLAALAIFQDGFSREAAQAVTEASLRDLMLLANKSLLQRAPTGRYEIQGLLRQYALEQAQRNSAFYEAARARHAAWYCAFLARQEADFKTVRFHIVKAEIEVELQNIRYAWDWAVQQGEMEQIAPAAWILQQVYLDYGRYIQEGVHAFQTAVTRLRAMLAQEPRWEWERLLVRLLIYLATFTQRRDLPLAAAQLAEAQTLLEMVETAGHAIQKEKIELLAGQFYHAEWSGNRENADQLCEQAIALSLGAGDAWHMMVLTGSQAKARIMEGDYAAARALFQEAIKLAQLCGHKTLEAKYILFLSGATFYPGSLDEGVELARQSYDLYRRLNDRLGMANASLKWGEYTLYTGEFAAAQTYFDNAIAIFVVLGLKIHVYIPDATLQIMTSIHLGAYQAAESRLESLFLRSNRLQNARFIGVAYYHFAAGLNCLARQAYVQAAAHIGESVTNFQKINQRDELGWALSLQACQHSLSGDAVAAKIALREALHLCLQVRGFVGLMYVVPAAVLWLALSGQPESAVMYDALARQQPYIARSRWYADVVGVHVAAAAAMLAPATAVQLQQQGERLDWWETAVALQEMCQI